MKGTLVQLQYKGVEDIHLTGDPEISHFKTVYQRYKPFSMESIETLFNKNAKFDSICSATLVREGSLISKVYLEVDLPYDTNSDAYWTNRVGFNLIKKVELIIGNTIIERQYGLWMYLWSELSSTFDKHKMLDDLVGTTSRANKFSNGLSAKMPQKIIIPINFFFCKNIENALPVTAIKDQNITFKFYFEKKENCLQSGTVSGDISARLWIDHIFVERNEELILAQKDHTYLIEVSQHHQKNLNLNGDNVVNIPFKLKCKELIWVLKSNQLSSDNDKFTHFENNISSDVKFSSFYQHYNYGGWRTDLQEGEYNNTQLLALNSDFNMLSSVILNGLKVILYTGENFDGNRVELKEDNSGLGIYNDKIRSIKVININKTINLLNNVQIKIDSKNLFSTNKKDYKYFSKYLPYRYHTGHPNEGIYVYPFCLEPENYQLSGYLNLDNIKKFNLLLNCKKSNIRLFSLSYNIIEIRDNMCFLKYKY